MMLLLHVDASLNTGGLVGSQGGFFCGVTDKSLLEGCDAPWSPMERRSFKMSRTVPSCLGAEAKAMSVALGFVEWATLFLQELNHGQFDLQGAPAFVQERPSVCVTDCKSLCDHLSAVCSPWRPLADGLTKDKGEAVECVRQSLRSGSYMLRGEEQAAHEKHPTRVQELSASEERSTAGGS